MSQDPPPMPPPTNPPPVAPSTPPPPLTDAEARTWAMLAHLSVLLNLVTGFLGVIVPLIIYVILRERSRYVALQALQSFVMQLICWVGGGLVIAVVWGITSVLSAALIGLLCVPFALIITVVAGLLPLVALGYGIYGAIEANNGKDFRYWLIGDWVNHSF
jgi:uncharacterized Tic20 family protein